MKSVERVDPGCSRRPQHFARRDSSRARLPAISLSTRSSFHARFSASSRPEWALAPNARPDARIAGKDHTAMDEFIHPAALDL